MTENVFDLLNLAMINYEQQSCSDSRLHKQQQAVEQQMMLAEQYEARDAVQMKQKKIKCKQRRDSNNDKTDESWHQCLVNCLQEETLA